MKIAFFGSSLVSSYWNGAATYYRGLLRSMSERGHQITFYEPDAWQRQQHRDIADPDWARIVVYPSDLESAMTAVESARESDLVVKASGVGVFDDVLEEAVLNLKTSSNTIVFWDVDAPATLDRILLDPADSFAALVPRYDAVITYGGGSPVTEAYRRLGARQCFPIYNALDSATHHPVECDLRFEADVAFMGNKLPDREARVAEFFCKPAASLPDSTFLLGGSGWNTSILTNNIRYVDHVYTADHNAFNCSSRVVLNVTRDSMVRYGFSPATRVFEVAGAGGCLLTDAWTGIEDFFEPGSEILVAQNGDEVSEIVRGLSRAQAKLIGQQAYRRALSQHTYAHRAAQLDELLAISKRDLVAVLA